MPSSIDQFFPSHDIPKTRKAGIREDRWIDPHIRASFSSVTPEIEKAWTEHPVTYRWNSYGYRCAEFTERSAINVVSIGCSWVMGAGLEVEDTFAERFCRRLANQHGTTVTNWNLGFGGKANDYIARTLTCAIPILKPDIVIINFTHFGRREFFTADGRCFDFQHNFQELEKNKLFKWSPLNRELITHLSGLTSDGDDSVNFLRNYWLCERALIAHNAMWLYTATEPADIARHIDHLDESKFVGFGIELQDKAHDDSHPGPLSNLAFAHKLSLRFEQTYGNELRARLGGPQAHARPSAGPEDCLFPSGAIFPQHEWVRENFTKLHRGYSDEARLKAFVQIVAGNTMVSYDGLVSLADQVRYCERIGIEGALLDVGCWKGGCAGIMALANLAFGAQRRDIHAFDSFVGLPEPIAEYDTGLARDWQPYIAGDKQRGRLTPIEVLNDARAEDVENLLHAAVHYPRDAVHIHPGWFQDTIPAVAAKIGPIAVLRLDGDFYDSTRVALKHLFPLVVPGGFVIIDDYHLAGARRACDEYFSRYGLSYYPAFVDEHVHFFIK